MPPPIRMLNDIPSPNNAKPTIAEITNSTYFTGAKSEAFANENAFTKKNRIRLAPSPSVKIRIISYAPIDKSTPGINKAKRALKKFE